MSVISDNIRNFRKFRNMTQRKLADSLNVTVTTVANWERGTITIRLDTFLNLCKVLQATPNQLCGIDPCPELEEFLKEQDEEYRFKQEQTKRLLAYAEKLGMAVDKIKEKE